MYQRKYCGGEVVSRGIFASVLGVLRGIIRVCNNDNGVVLQE